MKRLYLQTPLYTQNGASRQWLPRAATLIQTGGRFLGQVSFESKDRFDNAPFHAFR
jgi:hypothetical protein